MVYAYNWPDKGAPRPWEKPGSALFYSFEIQVPAVSYSGPGVPYITAPVILRDSKSGQQFWVNPSVFDPRGGFKEAVTVDGCTGLALIASHFGSDTRFVRKSGGSSSGGGSSGGKGPSEAALIAALESAGKPAPSGSFVEGAPPAGGSCQWSEGDTCIEGDSIRYWEPASGQCPDQIRYEVKGGRSGGFFCDKEKTRTTEWVCFEDPLCAGTMDGWAAQGGGCCHRVVDRNKCREGASVE